MKTARVLTILAVALGLVLCLAKVSKALPMGTAFTYQGHLYDANYVANGSYDLQFKLYDSNDPCDCNQIRGDVNLADMEVIDGYFTAVVDFCEPNVFIGEALWLEVGIRPGDLNDPNIYTTLSPRQELIPVPLAHYGRYSYHAQWANAARSLDAKDGSPTEAVYVDNEGNVGIGTTSPSHKLNVVGDANITGSLYAGSGSTVLFVDDATNKVGIGTTSPIVDLHVYDGSGNANIQAESDGGTAFFVADGNTVSGFSMFENGVGKADLFWSPTFDQLRLQEAGTLGLVVDDGNVGIGTTNPGAKLEVNGQVKITGGSPGAGKVLTSNSSGLASWQPATAGGDITGVTAGNGLTGGGESGTVTLDVGAGTGISVAADSVSIDTSIVPRKNVNETITVGWYHSAWLDAERFRDYGNSLYYLDPANTGTSLTVAGNVGIGTMSPAGGLDVRKDEVRIWTGGGGIGYALSPGELYVQGDLEADGPVYMLNVYNTSASAKAVYVDSNGRLGSQSSSKRYKENIAPLQDDFSKILDAQPVAFTWKESKERGVGLIAEDMDEVGLRNLVIYDTKGRPDSVRYQLISLYLLEVVKEQAESMKQLKDVNESLRGRLDTLERTVQQLGRGKEVEL